MCLYNHILNFLGVITDTAVHGMAISGVLALAWEPMFWNKHCQASSGIHGVGFCGCYVMDCASNSFGCVLLTLLGLVACFSILFFRRTLKGTAGFSLLSELPCHLKIHLKIKITIRFWRAGRFIAQRMGNLQVQAVSANLWQTFCQNALDPMLSILKCLGESFKHFGALKGESWLLSFGQWIVGKHTDRRAYSSELFLR